MISPKWARREPGCNGDARDLQARGFTIGSIRIIKEKLTAAEPFELFL